MSNDRPLIFITNDDGYLAKGIRELADIASRHGNVVVVSPLTPQSAKSSALTIGSPLSVAAQQPIGEIPLYTVNGTPVDCVKLSMHAVLDRKPDLLLSGINHGSNAAVNNIYSGTMGAAMEGCVLGIPSIGFSLLDHSHDADFSPVLPWVDKLIGKVVAEGLPDGVCLNVNFPANGQVNGLKAVRAAHGHWTDEYADDSTPGHTPVYWLTGVFVNAEPDDPHTDEYWLSRGWGTVVPVRPDQTALDKVGDISALLG